MRGVKGFSNKRARLVKKKHKKTLEKKKTRKIAINCGFVGYGVDEPQRGEKCAAGFKGKGGVTVQEKQGSEMDTD